MWQVVSHVTPTFHHNQHNMPTTCSQMARHGKYKDGNTFPKLDQHKVEVSEKPKLNEERKVAEQEKKVNHAKKVKAETGVDKVDEPRLYPWQIGSTII